MDLQFDLSACDREPIHIPGAVQPHGVLLVVDPQTGLIEQAGGPADVLFGAPAPLSQPLASLIGDAELSFDGMGPRPEFVGTIRTRAGRDLDAVAHLVGGKLIVEFEPAPSARPSAAALARRVEAVTQSFSSARSIGELCRSAAKAFRDLTGFDRVMIYRFLPDGTGSVLAEDKAADRRTFLHHRFPASDIPRQARQLYLRNLIRVIPDVAYVPGPMVAANTGAPPLDMSMASLRSVSPIHIQYLKNMDVGASASMSIVRDGALWGLVACHHRAAKFLSVDDRTLCRLLAGVLSQQLARIEDAELYQQRVRARGAEDELFGLFARYPDLDEAGIARHAAGFLRVIAATGFVMRRGTSFIRHAGTPEPDALAALCEWLRATQDAGIFATDRLSVEYPAAEAFRAVGSGLVAASVPESDVQVLWFRAEQPEVVEWAGNPHKAVEPGSVAGVLTPRRSFEVWRETVRGRSEPWSVVDVEAAARVVRELAELHRARSLGDLNDSLRKAIGERDTLIAQKDMMLREGNHRIQNSLQIVSSMLTMQLRQTTDPDVRLQLEEALSRVNAVSLVHRRLYRTDQPRAIELETYVQELMSSMFDSLGPGWEDRLQMRLSPVQAPTAIATTLGLIISELVLNAAKYAYGGKPGPIEVEVGEWGGTVVAWVLDQGQWTAGAPTFGTGFGTRLVTGLVEGHGGTIERSDGHPGLVVKVTIPLSPVAVPAGT